MPIDIEEFERADEDFFRGGAQVQIDEVLEFLAYNPDQAYSRREIQSALDMNIMETLSTLSRLEQEGLVRHKGQYWTVAESPEVTERVGSPD